ncbi:YjbH domain-containing protein [Shewanella avicenniae]|uniref:YjbH domain-containing protein n=1 Tax=Shewanella avicenniae TaxID=2814294 RepID=A0ABX7QQE3_9GAMM|nr:YjbH domain-containing protein [Shewanella avicenniae]QSX33624.1 YjbH domain-containing protein [Shewanella avicenniae]
MQVSKLLTLTGLLLPCSASWGAWYDQVTPTRNDFGGIGLMQMPTARMAPDGDMSINYTRVSPYVFGAVNFQPLPWMSTSIRYVSVTNRLYGPESLSGDQSYKDKGFDVKFRLLEEGYYLPDVAVGFQDIGGTGLFSSEYLSATKRVGPFDFTLGMAWGYLGNAGDIQNPLCQVADRMCNRVGYANNINDTGTVSFNNFFRGDRVGLFAGVEYQTPWQPLTLKLEWDGNDYQHEPQNNNQPQDSRFNVGMVLKPTNYLDLKLSYERGNTLSFGFTLHTNLINDVMLYKKDPPVRALATQPEDQSWDKVAKALGKDAGFYPRKIYQNNQQVIIEGVQGKYLDREKADTRAAAILYNVTDLGTREYLFIEESGGMPVVETSVSRKALAEKLNFEHDFNESPKLTDVRAPQAPIGDEVWHRPTSSGWGYYVNPGFTQSLGGPDGFLLYQFNLRGGLRYSFNDSLEVSGNLALNLFNNFDKFKYDAPSNLPRVRTYIREYLTQSDVGISELQATWFNNFGSNWYSQVYAGYLEYMYGGVGGELLYRPFGKDYAFGVDLNAVKQRDFNQLFGFRDYETVTGHVSFYYELPWYNLHTQVDVGRYLAKDLGATFTAYREFDNGVRLGAYATFTDVSSEEYGEGSFTKGVFLQIPFDVFSTRSSLSRASFGWSPLTRDGGQKLGHKYSLYYMTEQRGAKAVNAREK